MCRVYPLLSAQHSEDLIAASDSCPFQFYCWERKSKQDPGIFGLDLIRSAVQEYLSEAKEGGSFGSIAGVPYKFVFYLHQKPETQTKKPSTTLTQEGKFLQTLACNP